MILNVSSLYFSVSWRNIFLIRRVPEWAAWWQCLQSLEESMGVSDLEVKLFMRNTEKEQSLESPRKDASPFSFMRWGPAGFAYSAISNRYGKFAHLCNRVHYALNYWLTCCCCHFSQLPAVTFTVQNLPFTEPMLAVWAQLVSLAGSKLEKQRMKKSLSRGLTGAERHNRNATDYKASCKN